MSTGEKGGERKKTGRPPKYPGAGARITHSLRIKKPTREKLIEAAAASGRSVSEEMEYRIDRSFEDDRRFGPPHISQITAILSAVLGTLEGALGAKWSDNKVTRAACKEALISVLGVLMPGDKVAQQGLLGPSLSERDQAISDVVNGSRVLAENPFMPEPELDLLLERIRAAYSRASDDKQHQRPDEKARGL